MVPRALIACLLLALPSRAADRPVLPLDVVASLSDHVLRAPVLFSPDGQWIAHTLATGDSVVKDTDEYAKSGKSLAYGDARTEAHLTHVRSGEVVRLGTLTSSTWSPVWSPDGRRVAFYSDEGGEAGIWIWEKSTRTSRRFPGVTARPYFEFETVQWSADGRRLLAKLCPEGMSVAHANALVPDSGARTRTFPPRAPGQASVLVYSSPAKAAASPAPAAPVSFLDRYLADLALLDVDAGTVRRIARRVRTTWFRFSPDEKHLAYSTAEACAPNSEQNLFDLHVLEFASGADRVLVPRAHLTYGMEVSWSPDGRRLAYLANGPLAHGEVVVAELGGAVTTVSQKPVPSLDIAGGELPPLWDRAGARLLGVGADGRLWLVDAAGGAPRSIAVEGFSLTRIVPSGDRAHAWPGDGRTAWAMGRSQDGERMGFFAVDLERATARPVLVETKSYTTYGAYTGDAAGAAIAFVSKDQQHPGDIWLLDARTGQARQATHLNPELERYELGAARLIEWLDADGRPLRGALLLPPGRPDGRRLPLVVSVYGGSLGSRKLNVFGFSGMAPALNMQVLATRGFAVLHPDAPLRPGHQLRDLDRTVMPGVNAAIEKGFADPDRLAVTGQSYGAWSSLALIGQSTRFKAAVLQAAVSHPDAIAGYLELSPDGSDARTGFYEEGQGNMTGHPWAVRDRYLENSPVFLFDRIETPVLMLQGARDGELAASDAIFVGLRRLGKTVEYRLYEGEGHVPQQRPNVIDSWKRRIEFLDEHLDLSRDAAGRIVYEGERARSRRTAPGR